jgi:hypothetical protein
VSASGHHDVALSESLVLSTVSTKPAGILRPGCPADCAAGSNFWGLVVLSLFIPAVMWYATSQVEPGAEKDRYRRAIRSFLIGLALVALQVVTSFIIVRLVLR